MANGYSFQTLHDYIKKNGANIIILRHDVDRLPKNALNIALIENELRIKGSYFFRIGKGDYEAAIRHFKINLEKFRKIYPVKTICIHGSPLSKWDNRDLWEKYDYRDFGIIAEPYFDIDFSDVSVRDKVAAKGQNAFDNLKFRSTMDIIKAGQNGLLPDRIMINTHPQRWDDRFVPWVKELVWQNVKNVAKKFIVSR